MRTDRRSRLEALTTLPRPRACEIHAVHGNLGVLYLNRGELYEAASEFEWARRLLPGHPDLVSISRSPFGPRRRRGGSGHGCG